MRNLARIGMWWVLRAFGLYSLVIGVFYAVMTLHLEHNYIPYADRLPYMATCLAFFAGTLILMPSTTPLWIREIRDPFSAAITVVFIVGITTAVLFGLYRMLPIVLPEIQNAFDTVFAAGALFFAIVGIWLAIYLGATAGTVNRRRAALMSATTPGDEFDPRMR